MPEMHMVSNVQYLVLHSTMSFHTRYLVTQCLLLCIVDYQQLLSRHLEHEKLEQERQEAEDEALVK